MARPVTTRRRRSWPGPTDSGPRSSVLAILLCLAVLQFALVLFLTRDGPGLTVDSGEYLSVAESVRDGHGLAMPYASYDEPYPPSTRIDQRVPLTQFPPLYPVSMAIGSKLFKVDVELVSRWMNALAYAIAAGLAGGLVWRFTRSILWASGVVALFAAFDLITPAAMAWSEPLQLVFLFAAIAALAQFLQSRSRPSYVLLLLLSAALPMTRYVGIGLVTGIVIVLTRARSSRRFRKLLPAAGVATVGLVPLALWFLRNARILGGATEKPLGWHPPGDLHLRQIPVLVVRGGAGADLLRLAVLGFVVLVVATVFSTRRAGTVRRLPHMLRRSAGRSAAPSLPGIAVTVILCYLATLVIARLILDSNITFDVRQLQSALALFVVLLASVGATAAASRRARPIALGLLVLALIGTLLRTSTSLTGFSQSEFRGYAAPRWTDSSSLAFIATLPKDRPVITNAPDAIWLRLKRTSLFLPLQKNLYSGKPNSRYEAQLTDLAQTARGRDAILAFFNKPTRGQERGLPTIVEQVLHLRPIAVYADSTIFEVRL